MPNLLSIAVHRATEVSTCLHNAAIHNKCLDSTIVAVIRRVVFFLFFLCF